MARTILFFAQFWLTLVLTMPFCLAYLLLKALRLNGPFRAPIQAVVRTWARAQVAAAGMEVEASGLERIPATGRVCLVANHEGLMDIMLILACVRRQVGFVAKKEGLWVPFVNLWIIALDSVYLDRHDVGRGKRSIDRAVRKVARGQAMIIFPEGTRSQGKEIGAFRHGSFKLATRAEALLVPISISGTSAVWERERRIRPARVSIQVHEPIETSGLGPEERRALPGRVHAIIAGGVVGNR
jgi:1-acyl-sn-glycerol-3-phosphate acyltransferase